MNVIVKPSGSHLQVTQTMVEDLICDPVFAAKAILGIELDHFQRARLRYMWWVPTVYDMSGVSSGKTIVDWVYCVLRALLLPNYTDGHDVGVYFPTMDTMKMTFWRYFNTCRAPIFRANLGELLEDDPDGKKKDGRTKNRGLNRGGGTYVATFRSGGTVQCPAAGFKTDALSQSSRRYNTLSVEECTVADAMGDGVDKILIDRTTRESFNKNHPLWANHFKYSAHAEFWSHPGMARVKRLMRRRREGDTSVAVIRFSYKDYSHTKDSTGRYFDDRFRADKTMEEKRGNRSNAEMLIEAFGIPTESTDGFYRDEALRNCVALGASRGLLPIMHR